MLLMLLTGHALGVVAEDGLDGGGFVAVVFAGAGAVGVDVVDVGGGELGVGERFLHGDDRAAAFGVLVGDAEGVGGGAVADDFGEDRRAALLGVVEGFEDDHAGAFAEDESAALGVEGAAGAAGGFSLAVGEGGEAVEAGDAEGVDHGVRAAADHDVGVAAAEDFGGFADGLRAGGAGGEAVQRGAAGAGEQREMREGHVGLLLQLARDVHQLGGQLGPLDRVERRRSPASRPTRAAVVKASKSSEPSPLPR